MFRGNGIRDLGRRIEESDGVKKGEEWLRFERVQTGTDRFERGGEEMRWRERERERELGREGEKRMRRMRRMRKWEQKV